MQQRDAGRLNVFVDGRFAFALDGGVAAEVGLRVGLVLTDEVRAALEIAEQRSQARGRALRFLGHRERSRGEVARRLLQSGYPETLVDGVCDWLVGLGYVDDERFAEAFARQKRTAGWGARRIAAELERRGVERTLARRTAEPSGEDVVHVGPEAVGGPGASGEETWPADRTADEARLIALVGRRFGSQLAAGDAGAERRAGAFLARRGHDWDTIRRVLAAAAAGGRGDGPDGE